jgi:hypothetical protein
MLQTSTAEVDTPRLPNFSLKDSSNIFDHPDTAQSDCLSLSLSTVEEEEARIVYAQFSESPGNGTARDEVQQD